MHKDCFAVDQEEMAASKDKEQKLQAELDVTRLSAQAKDQMISKLEEQVQEKQKESCFYFVQYGELLKQQQKGKAGPNCNIHTACKQSCHTLEL